MCGCGPSVDTYGATLNVHDFVQCYAIERLLVTPRVCRIYRRFTLLLLVPPQTTVLGATLNAKLRGGTLNEQWPFIVSIIVVQQLRPRPPGAALMVDLLARPGVSPVAHH